MSIDLELCQTMIADTQERTEALLKGDGLLSTKKLLELLEKQNFVIGELFIAVQELIDE